MPTSKTTTQRNLGWQHQKTRERLLHNHIDGTLCWWCARPMYRDRTLNWDYDPTSTNPYTGTLQADHSHTRATGGTKADRLLHAKCNKERGDGSRDHLRPALTGQPVTPAPTTLGPVTMPWPWT